MSINLNGLPSIVEVTKAVEYKDSDGKETAMVDFKTNRFKGYLILGDQNKNNLLSSYVETIGIAPLNEEEFCIFDHTWDSTVTNDIRNLARKVVEAASDVEWRDYGPRDYYRR